MQSKENDRQRHLSQQKSCSRHQNVQDAQRERMTRREYREQGLRDLIESGCAVSGRETQAAL